jgi:DNA polymerase-4
MSSCVLHLDIDAFFAQVEQLRNPNLLGKPVAVGSGVVASASYEARHRGIHAGMPLQKARELCAELTIIAGHAPIYRCFSEHLFSICAEYSPSVETHLDEAYCDWSGTERLYPDPAATAVEIRHRVLREVGLRVTAGVGRNRMLAKMASTSAKPDGLRRLLPQDEEAFLHNLPVSALPGVGAKTRALLAKLNIATLPEMHKLSRESLLRMLGRPGLILYERCRGRDTQPISQCEIPRSLRRETSFHRAATDRATIEGMLYYLLERAANTLRRLGLEARQLGVKIRYSDGRKEEKVRKLPIPTQLDSDFFASALEILHQLRTRRVALHLIGVILTGLTPASHLRQLEILTGAHSSLPSLTETRRERRLLQSLDSIRERFGYASVVCGRSVNLLGKFTQDDHGFILRTSSLTQ